MVMALLLILAACGGGGSASSPSPSSAGGSSGSGVQPDASGEKPLTKVTLRLRWLHQAQFAGFYAAVEKGFYKDAGLEVDIQPGGPDFPAVQMVASGGEQFGVTGPDQIVLSREKGVPVVAVAAIHRKSPFVLFSTKESGIKTMKDMIGKNVGVKLSGSEELEYRAMMKSAGIDRSQVHETVVKFDMAPFLQGQVDVWPGYLINEVLSAEEAGKELNIINPNDYGVNMYGDTLFTTEKMIKDKPEIVKAFVQASMKGWDYAINHPDEAAAFGMKYSDQLNIDHEKAMMQNSIDLLDAAHPPLGKMAEADWESLQQMLLDMGFTKKKQGVSGMFSNSFIE
ncbi:ABC transporter substrate-binding protein [Paenibacillus humicola]|uniref:ABC transporter substrate-binding protein n=1 Tax=Paenibacillus humicola TaxID=3110540 RepID=UPI00237BE2F9|nr:ABC transporter substrate-binding protein [Paenibacillus humicola]